MDNLIYLSEYLNGIRDILLKTKGHHRRYEEATFYPLFSNLIKSFGFNMGPQQKSERTGNKPDFTIYSNDKIIGCIECKNLSKKLDDDEIQGQVNKYSQEYVNVILTNFLEFRLYQNSNLIRIMRFENLGEPSSTNINDFNDIISNFYKYGIKISQKTLSEDIAKHKLSNPLWEILSLFIGFFIPIIFKNIFYILFNIKQQIYLEIAGFTIIIIVLLILKNKKWGESIKIQNLSLKFSEIWIIIGTGLALILTSISIWSNGFCKLLSPSIDYHSNSGIKNTLYIVIAIAAAVVFIGLLIRKKNE